MHFSDRYFLSENPNVFYFAFRKFESCMIKNVLFLATLDGSICSILPLPEKPYRRLLMLQNKLTECLQHKAGLNPRAFRLVSCSAIFYIFNFIHQGLIPMGL